MMSVSTNVVCVSSSIPARIANYSYPEFYVPFVHLTPPLSSFSPSFPAPDKMFRSIPSRRLSSTCVPRSLLVHSTLRSFSSNTRPSLKTLSLRPYTQPNSLQLYHPRFLLISKSLFSTTQLHRISDAEKKAKLEEERQNALKQKLEADPENVTSTSSMTPIFDPKPKKPVLAQNESGDDPDMLRGLKSDLVWISYPAYHIHPCVLMA